MSCRRLSALLAVSLIIGGAIGSAGPSAQQRGTKPPPSPGPMLAAGTVTFDTPALKLTLVASSQTVAALQTKTSDAFDFTPGDLLVARSQNGYYHLGDLDLRVRNAGATEWTGYSTAVSRTPVTPMPARSGVLAAADLTPTLPADLPLRITRSWSVDQGVLALRFELTNRSADRVEIGSLGIPMVFNNVLNNRSLDEAHARCVFYDPYIGNDAGYLQVTRLNGQGPALVVVPDGRTPFEAYNPILNPRRPAGPPGTAGSAGAEPPAATLFADPTPRGTTFEGFYDWMAHTRAFAENEWKKASPWNPPTSAVLAPGETRTYGVRFLVADAIRSIEPTLSANARPVAIGIPGYILPTDIDGRLFVKHGAGISRVDVDPAGALTLAPLPPTAGGWKAFAVNGRAWGRARVAIRYADGTVQTIQYMVTKPAAEAVADLGRFLTTRQWFVDPADPFKRSPSVMTFDRDENRIVTQDTRVWVSGLGDEGGSIWLAGAMKQLGQPDQGELAKYQEFIDRVVWGGLQYNEGPRQFAVRKSLFYYQPEELPPGYYRPDLNWTSWTSWKKAATEIVDRSYDYPHVAALHWTMYRLARNQTGRVTNHPWDWYLTNAYQTFVAMVTHARHYSQFGQMEGTIFLDILRDLQREGWTAQAADMEARMKQRADVWMKLAYPFGSEMPWDSTGQEEVYAWTRYFGDTRKAQVTLDAIVAYMPALPHWGYNGSARRYWDFQYAGKLKRIERQLHHYGSGLSSIPTLTAYRDHPDDLHLLRIGYGGLMGPISSIDQEGFASAAFHAFPDMLAFDGISGDYAQNFLGHALGAATYVVNHPDFGWQAFGGNLRAAGGQVVVTPLDAFRSRVYIAPVGLWLTLDAGRFERIEFDARTRRVRVALAAATPFVPHARLRIEQPASMKGVGQYRPPMKLKAERGAYTVPLASAITWVELTEGAK